MTCDFIFHSGFTHSKNLTEAIGSHRSLALASCLLAWKSKWDISALPHRNPTTHFFHSHVAPRILQIDTGAHLFHKTAKMRPPISRPARNLRPANHLQPSFLHTNTPAQPPPVIS